VLPKLKKRLRVAGASWCGQTSSPVGGVVKAIYVDDEATSRAGERLISLEPADQAPASLPQFAALIQENQFYQAQMVGAASKAG